MTASSTIRVIGGTGYIGNHVVPAPLDIRLPMMAMYDLSTDSTAGVPLVRGSTSDVALVLAAMRRCRVEAMVHRAAALSA